MTKAFYVDLGSHEGKTIEKWLDEYPDSLVLGFELNPSLAIELEKKFSDYSNVIIYNGGAGIRKSVANFYPGINSDISSTLVLGKDPKHPYTVDYNNPQKVNIYNTALEILKHYKKDFFDLCVMKMDVEGYEYTLIPYLLEKNVISLFDEIRVEWHHKKYNIDESIHQGVYESLKCQCEKIVHWK